MHEYVVDEKNIKKAVLIPLKDYNELLKELEHYKRQLKNSNKKKTV